MSLLEDGDKVKNCLLVSIVQGAECLKDAAVFGRKGII